MRCLCWTLLALMAVVAMPVSAAPDPEDLPPVDELVQKLISGEVTPKQFFGMIPGLPEQYVMDVKHGLPDELKQQIAEIMREVAGAEPAEPVPEPAAVEAAAEADEDDEFYTEDEEVLEEEEEGNVLEERAGVSEALQEPAAEQEEVPEPEPEPEKPKFMLRAEVVGDDMGGSGGSGGSGSGGVAEGGVLPALGGDTPLDDFSAGKLLLGYSKQERELCGALHKEAYPFYTSDNTRGPNKVGADVAYLRQWRYFAGNASEYDLSGIDRPELMTALMLLRNAGVSALSDGQLTDLVTALTNMETKFSTAKVCDFFDTNTCDLKLYQDIRVKLASSENRDELAHYWRTWRSAVGRNSAALYAKYVGLLDQAAKIRDDTSDAWSLMLYPYRHGSFNTVVNLLEELWDKSIAPLYGHLHSYARIRLQQRYGADAVPAEGPIPAHLFGSLEADDWSALEPLMRPVDNASSLDFYGQCNQQNVDVGKLKIAAGNLYSDLGLNVTTQTELILSRLDVDADSDTALFLPRVLDGCHQESRSAVGIYPTNTTLSDYVELIELFATMQRFRERAQDTVAVNVGFPYKDRLGYNDYGLDLAIGGARALAAISPEGLKQKLGFQLYDTSAEAVMNYQMVEALKMLPRLAASMAALKWQSGVMTGQITESQYNAKWWEYKHTYQGVSPPEERTSDQFDALADGTLTLPNYHIRRLIGGIVMFSVHKYHCTMYGDATKPTTECAIFDSTELAKNIKTVLVQGNSKDFKSQLQALTGQRDLSADALVERMQPLADWLVAYNEEHGEEGGGGMVESTETIAIIVGVVIAVIVIGLVVFFVVARKKQNKKDGKGNYRSTATDERQGPQNA